MSARKIILLLPLLFFYASSQGYALDYIPIVLQWEPVEGADAYLLYYGDDSRHNPDNANPYNGTEAMKEEEEVWIKDDSPIEVGNVTQFTIQIPDDEAYFFAVRTVDNDESYPYSDFSNEEATLCISWPTGGFCVNANNHNPYPVVGRADAGALVELFDGASTLLGTDMADSDRNWSIDVDFGQFSEGTVTLRIQANGITAPAVIAIYDKIAPESEATAPASASGVIPVTWTADDATSGVDFTELWCEPPGGIWGKTRLTSYAATIGTFYYTPTNGDGTYYFATVSTDAAGNVEDKDITNDTWKGDTSVDYIASINTGPTGREGAGGCFITTAAPDLVSGQ